MTFLQVPVVFSKFQMSRQAEPCVTVLTGPASGGMTRDQLWEMIQNNPWHAQFKQGDMGVAHGTAQDVYIEKHTYIYIDI